MMHAWQLRREQERAEQMARGQSILAKAARRLSATEADRAEAERLIALPYGAENYALRRFVLDHDPMLVGARAAP